MNKTKFTPFQEQCIDRFRREVCLPYAGGQLEDTDWYDLSVGFFLGCGGIDLDTCFAMASYCRYYKNIRQQNHERT